MALIAKGYLYQVKVRFEIPREWLDRLIVLSQGHYDSVCKNAGRPGPGAFLHGMKTRADHSDDRKVIGELTIRELDTTCKILEMEMSAEYADMVMAFLHLLHEAMTEDVRINRPTPTV